MHDPYIHTYIYSSGPGTGVKPLKIFASRSSRPKLLNKTPTDPWTDHMLGFVHVEADSPPSSDTTCHTVSRRTNETTDSASVQAPLQVQCMDHLQVQRRKLASCSSGMALMTFCSRSGLSMCPTNKVS